jgi:hypothetical protein
VILGLKWFLSYDFEKKNNLILLKVERERERERESE